MDSRTYQIFKENQTINLKTKQLKWNMNNFRNEEPNQEIEENFKMF